MSTFITPGGAGSNLTIQSWRRSIFGALYETMLSLPNFEKGLEKIGNELWLRRMGRVGIQTLASTSSGTGFTFDDVTPTVVPILPTWVIAAASYPDSMPRRGGDEVKQSIADTVNEAVSVGIDNLVLQNAASSTYNYGNAAYDIEVVGLRTILQNIHTNSKNNAKAGDLMLILGTTQISPSLNIPEINRAYERGDGTSPLVVGRMATGVGFKFAFTTNLYGDVNGTHGLAFKRPAISYNFNQEPTPEKQRFDKQTKVMCDSEIGSAVVFPEMLYDVRHQ